MQDQRHYGNVESTSSCGKEVRSAIDKGREVYVEEYAANLEDTSPTPRHERPVQTPERTVGLGGRKTEG